MFEMIFAVTNRLVPHPGIAIIFLSLAVNFLVLPLYKRADAMQVEERDKENAMAEGIAHLKQTFKGDERFMMLQTYYKQNDYSPTHVLKGSVSLFLQIPFFMAAYRFLSGMKMIRGVSFGPISDLGAPDNMFTVFGFGINVLPILMTVISLVSAYIYTKGLPAKSRIQLFVMAAFFLVFLYNSPSGLAFYWLLNNVFSMLKNIFYRLKRPGLVLSAIAAVCGAAVMAYAPMTHYYTSRVVNLTLVGIALVIPFVLVLFKDRLPKIRISDAKKGNGLLFFLGGLLAAALTGMLIPSEVMKTSPEEFIDEMTYHSPNTYLLYSGLIALGLFVIWLGFFYVLASPKAKNLMATGICLVDAVFVTDYMFFGKGLGQLNNTLVLEKELYYSGSQKLINLAVLVVVVAVLGFVFIKFRKIASVVILAGLIAIIGMSVPNMSKVQTAFYKTSYIRKSTAAATIPLSTEGRNVVVIFLDRAIGCFAPYIFNEDPELLEQFDGFTYYENSVAFGCHTKFAGMPLEGGYEYLPWQINERSEDLLVDKQNEALKVMPVLFDSNGFETTVCDPPFANYRWTPDLSIYDEYPDIRAFNTEGAFNDLNAEFSLQTEVIRQRNFFCYSLFKVLPVACQESVYNKGIYNRVDADYDYEENDDFTLGQSRDGYVTSNGVEAEFMNAYTVLTNLQYITDINNSDEDTFLFFANNTTHCMQLLQEPEYEPAQHVDNADYDDENWDRFTLDGRTMNMDSDWNMMHYQINMAAYRELGDWFDYLREEGVYDNTRIILVSDHGFDLDLYADAEMNDDFDFNITFVDCLLMVKDFDAEGFTVSDEFMTNADVPTLATSGVIDDPVNPFTGVPINMDYKDSGDLLICYSHDWNVSDDKDLTQFARCAWYRVQPGYMYDIDNYTYVGYS